MSISSHLTPEPERRLWIIFELMRDSVAESDRKIAAITAFAAVELLFFKPAEYGGFIGGLTILLLAAALPLGALAFSPLKRAPKWLPALEPAEDKPASHDSMIIIEDIVKYTRHELVNRLDKYLGGGITATPYYEDIVGQIVEHARVGSRKRRLFHASCLLVGLGQAGLFIQRIGPLLSR